MIVRVKMFAKARDIVGADFAEIELPDGSRVRDLRAGLCERFPALSSIASSLHVAINNDYAGDETIVPADADIACFPPVSGG